MFVWKLVGHLVDDIYDGASSKSSGRRKDLIANYIYCENVKIVLTDIFKQKN